MVSPLCNLPQTDRMLGVLVVSASVQDHIGLRNMLRHTDWTIHRARNCREALEVLNNAPITVILCDPSLPDGTWKDLHESLPQIPVPPLLIVSSSRDDGSLWSEVLNLGAYDVVAKPFDQTEVIRVVTLAWLSWKEALGHPAPARVRTTERRTAQGWSDTRGRRRAHYGT